MVDTGKDEEATEKNSAYQTEIFHRDLLMSFVQ